MHILFGHLASASGGHRRKRLRLATVMAVFALVVFLTVCTQGLARNSVSKNHHGAANIPVAAAYFLWVLRTMLAGSLRAA